MDKNNIIENIRINYMPNNFKETINQLKEIAEMHIDDFQIISKKYLSCVFHVINSNIDINKNKDTLESFYQLIIDVLFIQNNYNFEFGNFIFNLFEKLIHRAQNKETYELLISKLFSCIYDKKDKGIEKYKKLINSSQYINKFLKNIPKIKDENIMNVYFSKILMLMQGNYNPIIDIQLIIEQLDIYLNNPESNMNIIKLIINHFNQILDQNNSLIDYLLNKSKFFDKIIEIVRNPNPKFTKEIKLKVLDFLELILLKNNDKYEFTIPYNIELGNDSLSFKLNNIIILYEEDSEIYYEKISKLIDIIENSINEKKVVNAIEYFHLLFSIIKLKKCYYLNLSDNTIKINNLLYQLCSLVVENINNKNDTESEKLLNEFLKKIFGFIFEFNKKLIDHKLKKNIHKKEYPKFLQSPKIFEKKKMKSFLKIFFDSSPIIRKKTVQFLLNISVENKLIISPYIFTQMIKIFFKDKNYTELQKLITLLNELFEFEDLNIKMMLQFNIVPIFMKLILEIPQNEKFGIVIMKVFENLCKYLTRYHLEKYMLQIYNECRNIKNALIKKINFSNEFFLQLIELLKKSLKKSREETLNCIYISRNCYSNPLIYNMLYMNSLFFSIKNKLLSIYLNLKISSYENIHNFSFCNIQNENSILNFNIDNKQNLNVIEKNNNIENIIFIKEKFNENLKPDKIYHQILITINTEQNNISLFIDKNKIFTEKYKLFQILSELFNFYIGYNGNDTENLNDHSRINSKNNILNNSKIELKTPRDNNSSFISISYLLITNNDLSNENFNDIMKENNIINGKNKKIINLNEKRFKSYLSREDIIAEVLFNNQDIKLSHSNKFNYLNSELKFINYDEIKNKYIPYIECYNPKGYKNKLKILYLISKCDNIQEFISFNQIYQIEKIHKGLIKNKLFIDYGINLFICNTFFIDFFIGLIYEYDGLNLEDMSFFSENILDLLKIILSIDDVDILNYFLNENDIMKVKLKIFFQRNKNILNDENFIDNLIRIFDNNKKFNTIIFILYETILIDELIFYEILDKNTVISLLKNNLLKISKERIDIEVQKTLYNIYIQLHNIINYFELSLVENNDGATLLDLIIECEKSIIKILFISSEKYIYIPKITNKILEFKNMTNRISLELNGHNIDLFLKNYNSIIEKKTNFLNSEIINSQMKNSLKELLDTFSTYFNENNNAKKNNSQDITQNKRCLFCEYVANYITLNFCNIKNNLKFLKYKNKYYSNAYLNFHIYQKELNPEKFAWYLSEKEGISRIRNKFVFKENDFHSFEKKIGKNEYITKIYKYEFSKEKFEEYYQKLNQILIYDTICKDYHFYNNLFIIDKFNKDTIINNCLYLKRIQKTNSLFILTNEFIYLYTNLIIDQNGIIHVNNGTLSNGFWAKTKEDSILELNNFINDNCDIYKPNDIKEKTESRRSYIIQSKFGFDCNYKLIIKKIPLRKITEMYKRNHLHIENSIEILLKNGSSYFFVFNIDKRDDIFNQIISNLNNYYQNFKKQPSIINFPQIEIKNPNLFYLKYSPKNFSQTQSNQSLIKKNSSLKNENVTYKIILDTIKTANEQSIRENWINIKITNFDYIMLLNTLSGRTYNDFSQYLIFPWILQNFNNGSSLVENIFGEYYLNIIRDQLYRNLYYPIFAQTKEIRENLKIKYDLKDDDSRYHSGTFYSTHAFVSYFLIRQRPFTEIHLEIQGGQFDAGDRLFIGENQLSNLDEKYQELIPALFTIPELYFNTNHFKFGETQNKMTVDNFELPNWCKKDPRLFCLIIKKMLEGKKINENIHHWFDLIFGFRQEGIKACEVFNTYRSACYKMNDNQLKEMILNDTINTILFEKEELGCMPNLLFNKEHPKRIKTEWINRSNVFFDNFEKVSQCKIKILKNFKFNFNLNYNQKIVDIVLLDYNVLLFNNNFKQGGICSLYSLVNSFNKKSDDCDNLFDSDIKFAAITKGNIFCGKKKNKYLTFHEKYLILVHPFKNLIYNYYIGENVNITTITCNDKGNKIYIGFENGNIKEYKLTKDLNSINKYTLESLTDKNGLLKYEQNNYLILSKSKIKDLQKEKKNSSNNEYKKVNKKPYIFYTKNSLNYPHNPIKLLKLNESFNVLISIDTSNTIYIISINNNFQLLHIVKYLTNTKQSIKDIIVIPSNGDFLVYTSLTVYLFSINGIPLSVLYLTDKAFNSLSPITCCTAVSLYDVVLFLGHQERYITIWKIVNRDQNEDLFDRTSHTFNKKTSKYFLNDYNYGYNINDKAEKKGESELIRKFDIVTRIDYESEEIDKNVYFNFMKMSHDMSYLILIDNINNFYVLNYTKDKKEINNNTLKKILADGSYCVICKRDLSERISRLSIINSTFLREEDRKICDDCRKHLTRCDNLLYGY